MEISVLILFLAFFLEKLNLNEAYVPAGYLGCYIDKTNRILSHRVPDSALNSGDQCKLRCKAAGYKYAGTEYSVECFCGNIIKKYQKGLGCISRCPGNKDEICGGTWHISLYDTKTSEVYVPSGYLGCYKDKNDRILSHRMSDSADNSGDQCKQKCKTSGYKYAGTENKVECFCGNIIKNYPEGSECSAICPGNKNEMCGGPWHISVYDTGVKDKDMKYCDIYRDACPPKWKCRNKKNGFICKRPSRKIEILT